ncbi:hypothetical protein HDU98_003934 [Podochytrium sp. JEL0797]|nr:hypothetical protein HDU98_003934 [Podochytrium sp. JEL0797]
MQYFHIQGNNFLGTLPAGMANWNLITVAELQGNCFTGTSPNPKITLSAQITGCPTTWAPLGNGPAPPPVVNPTTAAAVATSAVAPGATSFAAPLPKTATTAPAAALQTTAAAAIQTTLPPPPASSPDSSSSSPSTPVIAIAGGGAALLLLITFLACCYCNRVKSSSKNAHSRNHVMLNDEADGTPAKSYNEEFNAYELQKKRALAAGGSGGQVYQGQEYPGNQRRGQQNASQTRTAPVAYAEPQQPYGLQNPWQQSQRQQGYVEPVAVLSTAQNPFADSREYGSQNSAAYGGSGTGRSMERSAGGSQRRQRSANRRVVE